MTRTYLLRDLAFSGQLSNILERVPVLASIEEFATVQFFYEDWLAADVVAVKGRVVFDTCNTVELLGLSLAFGHAPNQTLAVDFSFELPSAPTSLLLLGACVIAGVIDEAAVIDVLKDVDISDSKDFFDRFDNLYESIALTLGPLPVRLGINSDYIQQGQFVRNQAGAVVTVAPHPSAPPLVIPMGSIEMALSKGDVDIAFTAMTNISLPPLIIRGTDLALELQDLILKMEDGPLPTKLASLGAERGFDDTWRGIFAKKIVLWNLDRVFPGGPKGDAKKSRGARVTASFMAMDSRGLTGDLSWTRNAPNTERLSLTTVTLGFNRDWLPSVISAKGRIHLTDLGGSNLNYIAQLEANPFADSNNRWRLLLNAEGVTANDSIVVFESPTTALVSAVAALATAFGETDSGLVLAALAAGNQTGLVKWQRIEINAAQIEGSRADSGGFAFSGWLSVSGIFELSIKDSQQQLNLSLGQLDLAYHPDKGVESQWVLDNGFDLTLPLQVEVGGSVTLNQLSLRKRSTDILLFELGVDIEGADDVAIGGMPNIVTFVYKRSTDTFTIEISREGQTITLLVPEVLYASGTLISTNEKFPSLDEQIWGDSLRASLTAYLVGNGEATKPSHHLEKAYYLFALDIGLMVATRSDGLKAVVLSGDLSLKPGIPIGATGAALYGIGLTYAQNATPNAGDDNDYTGWYLTEPPAFSTHASKWAPAGGNWGFGASISIGSQADEGRSWNAAAGLFLQLPGPVIVIAGKGNLFTPPVELPQGDKGKNVKAPFSAALALDFLHDRFSAELIAELNIEANDFKILELGFPARIDASLTAPLDMELSIGRFDPKSERVSGKAIEIIDISAYVMATTRGIDNFPEPRRRLEPFALAYGGSGGLSTGFSSALAELKISVEAGYDLGVSLANPPLMVGQIYANGQLYVRLLIISTSIDIETKLLVVAPDPFELTGRAKINISLPWPIPDISFEGSFSIGDKANWPDDYPKASNPISDISLFPRPNGTSILENGESFDGKVISEDTSNGIPSGIPLDTGILLAFRAPVGNEKPLIGQTQTQADDAGRPVWEVATTSIDKNGESIRYGWRHVLTKVRVLENSSEITVNAGWGFKAVSGNSDTSTKEASGNQASRTTLAILAPLDTPIESRFGMGAEVLSETINGWNPCEQPPNSKKGFVVFCIPSAHALGISVTVKKSPLIGLTNGGIIERHVFPSNISIRSLSVSSLNNLLPIAQTKKTTAIPPETRGTLIRHGLFKGPNVKIHFSSPPIGTKSIVVTHTTLGPSLISFSRSISNLIKQLPLPDPLKIQQNCVGIPTVVFSKRQDAVAAVSSALLVKPPCGELFLDIPTGGTNRTSMYFAIHSNDAGIHSNQDVILSIINTKTNQPLDIGRPEFETGVNGEVWCLYRITLLPTDTSIRVFAAQTKEQTPSVFGAYSVIFLGLEYNEEQKELADSIREKNQASSNLITNLRQQSKGWANGKTEGLLKPSTTYEVDIEVKSFKTRQVGDSKIEISGNANIERKTVQFKTEADIEQSLVPWLSPPKWAEEIEQHWNIKTSPQSDHFHYRQNTIDIQFADAIIAGRIAAHGRIFSLELTHVSGRTPEITATTLLEKEKKKISRLQDLVSSYIDNQPCINKEPLHLSLIKQFKTLLEPGEYIAKLIAKDNGNSRNEKTLHEWRFIASRWKRRVDHIASYTAVSLPRSGTALDKLSSAKQRLGTSTADILNNDVLLDSLLIEDLKEAPALPSVTPIVSIWVQKDGVTGLMLNGPEPLSFTKITLTPAGRRSVPLFSIVNDVEGSRTLILPDTLLAPGLFVLRIFEGSASNKILLNIPTFETLTEEVL